MAWEWRNGQRVKVTAVVTNRDALDAAVRTLGINETARQVGCSNAVISQLASGKQPGCNVDIANGLARVLDVPRSTFFTVETVGQNEQPVRSENTSVSKTA